VLTLERSKREKCEMSVKLIGTLCIACVFSIVRVVVTSWNVLANCMKIAAISVVSASNQ